MQRIWRRLTVPSFMAAMLACCLQFHATNVVASPYLILNPDSSSAPTMTMSVRPASMKAAMSALSSATQNFRASAPPDSSDWPALLSDGSGGAIIVYDNAHAGGTDLIAQHVLACGALDPSWPSGGVTLTTPTNDAHFPTMASDGAGGALVVWAEGSVIVNPNFTITVSPDMNILAQHLLGSGMVDPAWPAGGAGVCTAPGIQLLEGITADGNHGAFITWDDRRDGNANRHVFVHHLLSSGLDPSWPVNGLRVCPTTTTQLFPQLCSDGSGGCIVGWMENRLTGTGRDIYAQRLSANGSILWAATGVPVTTAFGLQTFNGASNGAVYVVNFTDDMGGPMVPDGAGGCFLTWQDDRTFNSANDDIYAQHLTSAGTVASGWPQDGTAVCTDPNDQQASIILADGAGGAIVTWYDFRSGVFAQHLSSSGVADGPVNGLTVSNAATSFSLPEIVHDGSSGAILFWSDTRTDPLSDQFAHHLMSSGGLSVDPAWPVNGAIVSIAPGQQGPEGNAGFGADGSGGALATWPDTRNSPGPDFGRAGIYAQKVLATGALPTFSASGTVQGSCPSPVGLLGVTVDAFEVGSGDLVASVPTNGSGVYAIPGLNWGTAYNINAVAPLDYATGAIDLPVDGCSTAANFALSCVSASGSPQGIGFWKHEVGVATGGNGHGQLTPATLCAYLDLIAAHFNNNEIHPVVIYQPPSSGLCADKLQVAKNLVNLTGSVAMIDRAKQQLMALLLNVAAGYISQTQVISTDGATVSQAITYCDGVIHNPNGNYSQANDICDTINNGQLVKAGVIPLSTQNISYAHWGRDLEFRVTPNPAHGPLHFAFSLAKTGPVDLSVYDVAGRRVTTLVNGVLEAGAHGVTWDAMAPTGDMARVGMYFARLLTRDGAATLRVLQMEK